MCGGSFLGNGTGCPGRSFESFDGQVIRVSIPCLVSANRPDSRPENNTLRGLLYDILLHQDGIEFFVLHKDFGKFCPPGQGDVQDSLQLTGIEGEVVFEGSDVFGEGVNMAQQVKLIQWPDSQKCMGCEHALGVMDTWNAYICLENVSPDICNKEDKDERP